MFRVILQVLKQQRKHMWLILKPFVPYLCFCQFVYVICQLLTQSKTKSFSELFHPVESLLASLTLSEGKTSW